MEEMTQENLPYFVYYNEKYYEPLDRIPNDKLIVETVQSACLNNYDLSEDRIFLFARPMYELPKQGWKIHVRKHFFHFLS